MPFIKEVPPRVRQSVHVEQDTIDGALENLGEWGRVASSLSVSDAQKLVIELKRVPEFEKFDVQTRTRASGEADEGRNVWLQVSGKSSTNPQADADYVKDADEAKAKPTPDGFPAKKL